MVNGARRPRKDNFLPGQAPWDFVAGNERPGAIC